MDVLLSSDILPSDSSTKLATTNGLIRLGLTLFHSTVTRNQVNSQDTTRARAPLSGIL